MSQAAKRRVLMLKGCLMVVVRGGVALHYAEGPHQIQGEISGE